MIGFSIESVVKYTTLLEEFESFYINKICRFKKSEERVTCINVKIKKNKKKLFRENIARFRSNYNTLNIIKFNLREKEKNKQHGMQLSHNVVR